MEDFFVALEQSSFTPSEQAGGYPYLAWESLVAVLESCISPPVDFEAAEPGPTLVTGGQDPDPYFLPLL